MRFLFLLTSCLLIFQISARESTEAFSFALPKDTEWKSRQAAYNSAAHSGHIELIPSKEHSLTSKEHLSISWSPYRGIHPTKQKATFIDSLRKGQRSKIKTRTLWHKGESIAFEVQQKWNNENRYQLVYIGHLFPFNVTVSYTNYDAKDAYQLRENYFPLLKALAHHDSKEGLSVSHKGVFINNEPIEQSIEEQLCAVNEPFILRLPSSWEIEEKHNRKDKLFAKDACFVRGKTEKCHFTFSLEHKAESSKELYAYIDERAPSKENVWAYDEREIAALMEDVSFVSYIPGAYECYKLEITGSKEDLTEEKEMILSTLKHIQGPYLAR